MADSAVEQDATYSDGPERGNSKWIGSCDRHIDPGRIAPDQPPGQLLSHRGRERNAAAVAAEIDQRARPRFVHMRIVIGGHGQATVPAACAADTPQRPP